MSVALAVVAALCWGTSTVCAALAVRDGSVIAVTLWSQLSGLVCGLPLLAGVPLAALTRTDAIAGAVAGLGSGLSLALLYASARKLQPGLASALNNTTAASIPIGVILLLGASATGVTIVGVALCLVAIPFATRAPAQPEAQLMLAASAQSHADRRGTRSSVAVAVASGCAMSVYYLAIAHVQPSLGVWAALEARASSCLALWLFGSVLGRGIRLTRRQLVPTVAGGVIGMAGGLAYAVAATRGPLIVVVPLVALSPLVTAVVSWRLLRQRLSPAQLVGLVVAMAGSALVSVSVR